MVKKLLSFLNREWTGLHEAAFLLGIFSLLSQVLAIVRDRLLASSFGAGQVLDMYYAAFRIPDFIFAGVASFLAALVLLPLLSKKANESDAVAQKFLNDIFTVFFSLLTLTSVGLFFATPWLTSMLFPHYTGEAHQELVSLTRLLLLSPIILGLSNLLGTVTQMLNKFSAFAFAPILYNLGIIVGALFFYPAFGMLGLGFGVILGAFLHFFVHFFVSARSGFSLTFSVRPSWRDIWDVICVSFPRTVSLFSNHLAILALVVFAGGMTTGSVAIFNFAFNLQTVPLTIVGLSYATAAFPSMAKFFNDENIEKFLGQILSAARHIIFWSLPVLVLFIVLRAQIVRTLLGSGAFDWTATKLTAAALAIFALSIVAQSIGGLFARGFYATGKYTIPLIINLISSATIIIGGFAFIKLFNTSVFFKDFIESLFRVTDVPGTEILMLPLAYSVGMTLYAILMLYLFRRRFGRFLSPIKETFMHGLFASLLAGFVAYEFLEILGLYLNLDTFWGIFLQGLGGGAAGVLVWWLILELMGGAEIKEVRSALHRKLFRSRVTMLDQESI